MKEFPVLSTTRLHLRQFTVGDAPDVQRLAGDKEVAQTTFVPHPYKDGLAEQWIRSQYQEFQAGRQVNFAVVLVSTNTLIGSIGLTLTLQHHRGQLGYWIGVGYWNQGYATEAARAVVAYGFDELKLHRIWAPHFASNPASGRVLQKVGMKYEGQQREHYLRFDRYEDAENYGVLRRDYEARQQNG